jgi:hypothetical protein
VHSHITKKFFLQEYDNKKFFIAFLVVYVALLIDVSIGNTADIIVEYATSIWGITLFGIIAVVYAIGQFVVLEMVKIKSKASPLQSNKINNTVSIIEYILIAIMAFVTLQIIFSSFYYTKLLIFAVALSYGLGAFLMGFLAYKLLSWFKSNKNLAVLLYSLAAAMITINAADSLIYFDVVLLGKPDTVTAQSEVIFQVGFTPGTAMSVVANIQTISMVASFLLTWGGTIMLLRYNIKRIGRAKFWPLVTLPIVYFMSYYIILYEVTNPTSPVTEALSSNFLIPILLATYAIAICGILFGIGFFSVAKSVTQYHHPVKDFLLITGYGFALFFTVAQATVLQAGYPPFGLANVSFVGLASFLILSGLYQAAIAMSHDMNLRRSVKKSSADESKLLDAIGFAQMQEEIKKKVMKITKENAEKMVEESKVEPSIADNELEKYLDEVLEEVRKKKITK